MLMGRKGFRQSISERLLPALRAFNPSLILMSTGFDTLEKDVGNMRDGEAGMNLTLDDIGWVTSSIMKVADVCCNGRFVSVLEGGYGSIVHQQQQQILDPRATRSKGREKEKEKEKEKEVVGNVHKKDSVSNSSGNRGNRGNSTSISNNENSGSLSSTATVTAETTSTAAGSGAATATTTVSHGLNRNVLVNAAVTHIHKLVDPYGPLPSPPFPISSYHNVYVDASEPPLR